MCTARHGYLVVEGSMTREKREGGDRRVIDRYRKPGGRNKRGN
jgi:hypothetical protein